MEIASVVHDHAFCAMGSSLHLWLSDVSPATAVRLFGEVEAYVARVEAALSRFRPQSELSRLNGRVGQWTAVSPVLWEVLTEALALAELTDGLYDPALLTALETAGYVASFELLAGSANLDKLPQATVGGLWRDIQLDSDERAVWLPPGARLDLGGMAKGYTAVRIVDMLAEWGPCLVDAGGDIVAGPVPDGVPGWPVAIAAPGKAESGELITIWLAEAALATSGIDYRRWEVNGRVVHHLIDPRTGQPTENDLLTVSVLLRSAAQAEAVATAVMILGCQAGYGWLAARHIPALLVSETGSVRATPAMEGAWATARS